MRGGQMRDMILAVAIILILCLAFDVNCQKAKILALQTDNATQWQQIRANNNDNEIMWEYFLTVFEKDEEGIWRRK
jgi:hypothetical protein